VQEDPNPGHGPDLERPLHSPLEIGRQWA
jgi:hypothetical protein